MKSSMRTMVIGLAVALTACASGQQRNDLPTNRGIITAEELQSATAANLYDAVRKLRPEWLERRRAASLRQEVELAVYHDNMRVGGPDALRSIEIGAVRDVRFLSASEAQGRFGVGHPIGAIVVRTRGG
jgi:hypothetical protein